MGSQSNRCRKRSLSQWKSESSFSAPTRRKSESKPHHHRAGHLAGANYHPCLAQGDCSSSGKCDAATRVFLCGVFMHGCGPRRNNERRKSKMVPETAWCNRLSHHCRRWHSNETRDRCARKNRHGCSRRYGFVQGLHPLILIPSIGNNLKYYRRYASVMYCCTMRCVLKNDPLMAIACCITSRNLCRSR